MHSHVRLQQILKFDQRTENIIEQKQSLYTHCWSELANLFEATSSVAFACGIMTTASCKARMRNLNAVPNACLLERMLFLCIYIARISGTTARV